MRIRKRQVPFPISSISPVPLSDPHFNRSPMVQLQLHSSSKQADTIAHLDPHPSDHPNQPIGGAAHVEEKKDCLVLLQGEEQKDRKGAGERSTNDTCRKKGNLGAEVGTQSSYSQQAFGRWCEREKAFPLKKRRGSFEREATNHEDTIIMENDKKVNIIINTKMKTKMNKKCVQQNGDHQQDEDEDDKETKDVNLKKRGIIRGGALMEGSRCSRVNGKGWRCCQQTLVGYSLCEHHLGKGRLRSITSVRSPSLLAIAPKKKLETSIDHSLSSSSSSILQGKQQKGTVLSLNDDDSGINGNGEDLDHKPPIMTTKKRVKLGMVKARSISSLLGQTNNAVAVADNER